MTFPLLSHRRVVACCLVVMKCTVDEGAITLLYYSLQYILITRNLSSSVATFHASPCHNLCLSQHHAGDADWWSE